MTVPNNSNKVDYSWALGVPCPTCKALPGSFCRSRNNPQDLYAPSFWVHVSRRNLAEMTTEKPPVVSVYVNGKLVGEAVSEIRLVIR